MQRLTHHDRRREHARHAARRRLEKRRRTRQEEPVKVVRLEKANDTGTFEDDEIVLIRSRGLGYWRPGGQGYTDDPEKAGRFTFADAYRRTHHCGPEKGIEYHAAGKSHLNDTDR